jgi:oligoendopeptidase F
VLNGGPAELQAYLGFLKSGGAKFPMDTLREAGVDMQSAGPIEKTMDLFRKMIGQLRELLVSIESGPPPGPAGEPAKSRN